MKNQRSLRILCAVATLLVAASACNKGNESAVKGRSGPNGAARDSVSDLALSEDGLGQIQIGMNLDDAVNMGLLNENPSMKSQCDFVFPAVPHCWVIAARAADILSGVESSAVRTNSTPLRNNSCSLSSK